MPFASGPFQGREDDELSRRIEAAKRSEDRQASEDKHETERIEQQKKDDTR